MKNEDKYYYKVDISGICKWVVMKRENNFIDKSTSKWGSRITLYYLQRVFSLWAVLITLFLNEFLIIDFVIQCDNHYRKKADFWWFWKRFCIQISMRNSIFDDLYYFIDNLRGWKVWKFNFAFRFQWKMNYRYFWVWAIPSQCAESSALVRIYRNSATFFCIYRHLAC